MQGGDAVTLRGGPHVWLPPVQASAAWRNNMQLQQVELDACNFNLQTSAARPVISRAWTRSAGLT